MPGGTQFLFVKVVVIVLCVADPDKANDVIKKMLMDRLPNDIKPNCSKFTKAIRIVLPTPEFFQLYPNETFAS